MLHSQSLFIKVCVYDMVEASMVFISPTNEFEGLLNVMEAIYASVIVLCHAFILGYKKGEWWLWFFVSKDKDQEDQLFLLGNFKEGSILAIARGDLVYPYVSHVTCVRQSCSVAA